MMDSSRSEKPTLSAIRVATAFNKLTSRELAKGASRAIWRWPDMQTNLLNDLGSRKDRSPHELGDLVRTAMRGAQHEERAMIEEKTGFLNGNGARYEIMERVARVLRGHGLGLAIAVMDIKNFKFLNDELGQSRGDSILKNIAHIIDSNIRVEDAPWRMGGDEFAVILEIDSPDLMRRMFFDHRTSREGNAMPSWLESVNQSVSKLLPRITGYRKLRGPKKKDAGLLRGGFIFLGNKDLTELGKRGEIVERIIQLANDRLDQVKEEQPSVGKS